MESEVIIYKVSTLPENPTVADDGIYLEKPEGKPKFNLSIISKGTVINLDTVLSEVFSNRVDTIQEELSQKALASSVYTKLQTYTQSEVNAIKGELETNIGLRALVSETYKKVDLYNKSEVDAITNQTLNAITSGYRGSLNPSDPVPTLPGIYIPDIDGSYPGGITVARGEGQEDYGKDVKLELKGTNWKKLTQDLPKADEVEALAIKELYSKRPYLIDQLSPLTSNEIAVLHIIKDIQLFCSGDVPNDLYEVYSFQKRGPVSGHENLISIRNIRTLEFQDFFLTETEIEDGFMDRTISTIEGLSRIKLWFDYSLSEGTGQLVNKADQAHNIILRPFGNEVTITAEIKTVGQSDKSIINKEYFKNQFSGSFKKSIVSSQLYDKDTNIPDMAVGAGVINSYPTAQLSQPIPVKPDTMYVLTWEGDYTGSRSYIWLDDEGNQLTTETLNAIQGTPIKSDEQAGYFQFTAKRTDTNEASLDPTIKFQEGLVRTPGIEYVAAVDSVLGDKFKAAGLENQSEMAESGKVPTSVMNRKAIIEEIVTENRYGQLYNKLEDIQGSYIHVESNGYAVTAAPGTSRTSTFVGGKAGDTYTLSYEGGSEWGTTGRWEDANGDIIVIDDIPQGFRFLEGSGRKLTITQPSDNAVRIGMTITRTVEIDSPKTNVKIEKGEEVTHGTDFNDRRVTSIFGQPIPYTPSVEGSRKTEGKTVLIFGDSASAYGPATIDTPGTIGSWGTVASALLGWGDTRNSSKSSATLADREATTYKTNTNYATNGNPDNVLSNQVYSLLRKNAEDPTYRPDIIVLLGGGNDLPSPAYTTWDNLFGTFEADVYSAQFEPADYNLLNIGNPDDATRYEALRVKRTKIFGALRWAIETCITHFPEVTFVICGTLQRGVNPKNSNLFEFTARLKKLANYYGCPYLDTTFESGMTYFTETRGTNGWSGNFNTVVDNIHRTAVGNTLIGRYIANRIEQVYFERPKVGVIRL